MTTKELELKEMRSAYWESTGEVLTRAELDDEIEYPNVDYMDLAR